MKKITIALIAAAVLAVGGVFVIAQKGMHRGFGGPGAHWGGPGFGMALRGLNLTDDQKAKVKEITDAAKTKAQPIRESLKANHEKMEQLTAAGAFDEQQVTELANQQGALTAQLIVEMERVKSQIFAILTDEQKAKAATMKEQSKERFKNRTEHRDGDKAPGSSEF